MHGLAGIELGAAGGRLADDVARGDGAAGLVLGGHLEARVVERGHGAALGLADDARNAHGLALLALRHHDVHGALGLELAAAGRGLADDDALFDGVGVLLVDGDVETGVVQGCGGAAAGLADDIGHAGALGAERQVVGDYGVLGDLGTRGDVLARDAVLLDAVGVFRGASLVLQAVGLQQFLSFICGFTDKIGNLYLLRALRHGQVDGGALRLLGLGGGVLADNLARIDAVGVGLRDVADLETGGLDGGLRLVKRLTGYVGDLDLLAGIAVSTQGERGDGDKRDHGCDGSHYSGNLLALLLRRRVVRHIRMVLRAAAVLVGAAHCRHDRSAVGHGADIGHVAHDLRLSAGEART